MHFPIWNDDLPPDIVRGFIFGAPNNVWGLLWPSFRYRFLKSFIHCSSSVTSLPNSQGVGTGSGGMPGVS